MADRIPSNRDQYVELCLIGTEQRANKPRRPQIRQPQLPRRTQATAEEWRELARIATAMGVEPNQLVERIRAETIPEQRQIAMWMLYQAGLSMRAVGRLLQIDSKSVSYAVGRIEQKRDADGGFAARVDAVAVRRLQEELEALDKGRVNART